jgi:hypothetical protein
MHKHVYTTYTGACTCPNGNAYATRRRASQGLIIHRRTCILKLQRRNLVRKAPDGHDHLPGPPLVGLPRTYTNTCMHENTYGLFELTMTRKQIPTILDFAIMLPDSSLWIDCESNVRRLLSSYRVEQVAPVEVRHRSSTDAEPQSTRTNEGIVESLKG